MPTTCCVVNCHNRHSKDNFIVFRRIKIVTGSGCGLPLFVAENLTVHRGSQVLETVYAHTILLLAKNLTCQLILTMCHQYILDMS